MSEVKKPDYISQEDWDAVDSPELTEEFMAQMKPIQEYDPKLWELVQKSAGMRRRSPPPITPRKKDAGNTKRYANTKA